MVRALLTRRRPVILLGLSSLALATTSTVVSFFLPLIVSDLTDSQLAIGFAVGVEGLAALTIPLVVGRASDRTWNRFGRRLPYMLAGTPLVVLGLVGMALFPMYWLIVLSVILFFAGYYMYFTAYQALYPDLLRDNQYGRVWAFQSIFQGAGVGLALLGGGALLTTGNSWPFFITAVFFLLMGPGTARFIREKKRVVAPPTAVPMDTERPLLKLFVDRLHHDRALRLFLVTHFCWEFTLAAIRAFVVLYLLIGMGFTRSALLPILGVVILAYLIASVVSGYIADRFDPRRYTAGMIALYTGSLFFYGLNSNEWALRLLLPFGMFAGAAVLMLAYPILLRVTPPERRGEYTGYYQFNRGLALLLGTSVTGAAIDIFGKYFPQTSGYQVLWLVTGVVALLSLLPFLALTNRSAHTATQEVAR